MAAGAAHPHRMPGIQDAGLIRRHERPHIHRDPLGVEAWLVPVHEAGEEREPASVMSAADEGPLPAHTVAACYRGRSTTRERETGATGDLRMTLQDLRRALIRQPGQDQVHHERELQV